MNPAIAPESKSRLMRAAGLVNVSLKEFVVRAAERKAHEVMERAERQQLSERDTALILALLDNPPAPNAKVLAAARDLPPRQRLYRLGAESRSRKGTTVRRSIAAMMSRAPI